MQKKYDHQVLQIADSTYSPETFDITYEKNRGIWSSLKLLLNFRVLFVQDELHAYVASGDNRAVNLGTSIL